MSRFREILSKFAKIFGRERYIESIPRVYVFRIGEELIGKACSTDLDDARKRAEKAFVEGRVQRVADKIKRHSGGIFEIEYYGWRVFFDEGGARLARKTCKKIVKGSSKKVRIELKGRLTAQKIHKIEAKLDSLLLEFEPPIHLYVEGIDVYVV